MNIFITGILDITLNQVQKVCDVLNSVKGEINFIPAAIITNDELQEIDISFQKLEHDNEIPFDRFFTICKGYRALKKIDEEDFVVILTSLRNSDSWFSATENRNIFIDTNDWDQITSKDPKYGISYQVIENVFQSIIGISHDNAIGHPNVHMENIGCINDMCEQKSTIMLKLRTADICNSCQAKAREWKVPMKIMNQIQRILESIQLNVKNLNTNNEVELEKVKIEKNGTIKIGSAEINMENLPAALYIFFLKQNSSIAATSLKRFRDLIYNIYTKIRPSGQYEKIVKLFDENNQSNSTFRKNKHTVNKAISESVNDAIVEHYIIVQDESSKYKINLQSDHIDLDPAFRAL